MKESEIQFSLYVHVLQCIPLGLMSPQPIGSALPKIQVPPQDLHCLHSSAVLLPHPHWQSKGLCWPNVTTAHWQCSAKNSSAASRPALSSLLSSSVASSSLAKQRSMLPDSSNCRSGDLNFCTISKLARSSETKMPSCLAIIIAA
ncbi:Uncharacterized protein Fot_03435 [Forsythia ovata]|uniref:Uncharacterized protein n=1 Tax=Forsythia ovata TaxID=205694 RepID=A0ABD1XAB5_9LAMI